MSKILFLALLCSLVACNNTDVRSSKDVKESDIYFSYNIWGDEDKENITIMLRFLNGGEDGASLLLEEPSKVELDGELIPVDSAQMTGAYYEVQKPLSSFSGKHQLTFTGINGKKHVQEFLFQPLIILKEPGDSVQRQEFIFQLEGVKEGEILRIALTDTSFDSNDINEEIMVENGELKLPQTLLRNVTNGPIIFQLYKEQELPITNPGGEGGKLSITYGLTREFELLD